MIWYNKRFVPAPQLSSVDRGIAAYRPWMKQFFVLPPKSAAAGADSADNRDKARDDETDQRFSITFAQAQQQHRDGKLDW